MANTDPNLSHGAGAAEVPLPDLSKFRKIKIPFPKDEKPNELSKETLAKIVKVMCAEPQNVGSVAMNDNENIPAGFTYVGQFLAHDITSSRSLGIDTPMIALQSLYGGGPGMMPYFFIHYEDDVETPEMSAKHLLPEENYFRFRHAKMLLEHIGGDQFDVPRIKKNSIPLMADARNDQNFLIAQIHCAFIRFHNAVAEWINFKNPAMRMETLYKATRNVTIHCYQRIIVEEYLTMLMYDFDKGKSKLVENLSKKGNEGEPFFLLFEASKPPQLMPEFAMAALRIGHSQVHDVYTLNRAKDRRRIFEPGSPFNRDKANDLRGFAGYNFLNFEWPMFFDFPGEKLAQPSGSIDHQIAAPMYELIFLPPGKGDLPSINIQRSGRLPLGHDIATKLYEAVNAERKKQNKKPIALLSSPEVQKRLGVPELQVEQLPLWLYILLEAEIRQGGQMLGVLGSHLIAEQIMWVLRQDANSLYNHVGEPDDAARRAAEIKKLKDLFKEIVDFEEFKMVDLLQFSSKTSDFMRKNVS